MPLLQRFTALITALSMVAPSLAGVEKESHSARPGLFFAWLLADDGYVLARFDDPAHLRKLAQHCNSGLNVFSLEKGTKYKCKLEVFKLPSGEETWESAGASVQGPSPKSDTRQFALFSTRPPRTTQWESRAIAPQELEALRALLQADARKFEAIRPQLKFGKALVVSRAGSSNSTVIVPGRIVEDREAFYYAQRHHVFVKRSGAYAYLGEIPGNPIKLVDIDEADIPGLVVSEGCDGWCVSLWTLKDELKQVGAFGGH